MLCDALINLKEKRFFLFLNLLRAVLTGFKSALFFDSLLLSSQIKTATTVYRQDMTANIRGITNEKRHAAGNIRRCAGTF
jgi:hypothetical protein